MKVVYLWKNGQQVIVEKNEDDEYIYPDEKWTEQSPPDGIYAPFYYDGQKWIGQTKEEFEKTLTDNLPLEESKDKIISDLALKLAETQTEMSSLKEDVANLTLLVANLTGGTANG